MSQELLDFAKDFVDGKFTADEFADPYQQKWKDESQKGLLAKDDKDLGEKLSTLFCLADQYCPDEDRHYSEYDGDELKRRVIELLSKGS